LAQHKRKLRRQGRPARAGRRTPGGRLAVVDDLGTRDLQRHKAGVVNGASDSALSASLAGVLFAHAVLNARQRDAADRFRRARAAIFGAILPDRDLNNRREATEEQIKRSERRYNALVGILTEDQLSAVVDLALDLRLPWQRRALLGLPAADGDREARQALLSGLDALAAS
jgi:hypothetical protein